MSNQFQADPHHHPHPSSSSSATSFGNNVNYSNNYNSNSGSNGNNGDAGNPNNNQNGGGDYGNSNNNYNNFDGNYGQGNSSSNNTTYDNGNNGNSNNFNFSNNSNNFGSSTYSSQGGDNVLPQQQPSSYPFQQQQMQQQQYHNPYQQPYIQHSSSSQFVDQQRQHQMMQPVQQQQYQQQQPNRQFAPNEYSNGYNQQSRQQQHQQHQQQDQEQQQQQQLQPQQQYRGQNDYNSQEGPTRSHRRGPPMENNPYSVRFNPSRNYSVDLSSTSPGNGAGGQFQSMISMNPMQNEQGTFLSRPRIPGLPCIGCKMSRTPCDGGSPCRSCTQNRVRCHYEGDNNMKFFGIDALQLEAGGNSGNNGNGNNSNGGGNTNGDNHSDNHDNPDNHSGSQQQYQHQVHQQQQRHSTALGSGADFSHPARPRSRSRSDSGSGSGGSRSGSLSGPAGSGGGVVSNSGVGSRSSGVVPKQIIHRVSPQIISPITLSDQSLISIPPFQELTQNDRQAPQNKVVLPSFSSVGSSLTSVSSNSTQTSRSSSSGRSNVSSTTSSGASRFSLSQQGSIVQPKPSNDRQLQPAIIPRTLSSEKSGSGLSGQDSDAAARRKMAKKVAKEQAQGPKDPLYSLSSASIRARKNAHETENIQRASLLYSDYIAKIKALARPADMEAVSAVSVYIPENVLSSFSKMDVDMDAQESEHVDQSSGAEQAKQTRTGGLCESGDSSSGCTGNLSGTFNEKSAGPIEGLERIGRSGLLHSLVQQYFTLIHPQFMILNKNQFLVKFWMTYGPFPEARELHVHIMQENSANGRKPSDESNDNNQPKFLPEFAYRSSEKGSSIQSTSPLLLLAMLALVSRHFNDRSPLKSTAEDKNRRIQKSFALINAEFQTAEQHSQCQNAARESLLQELMTTDEHGQSEIDHEDLRDRGEQYFHWATELLRAKYEEPSLAVVQSVLLLREYAIMAGNHQQAYMYGGTAITMAMELGWHRTQFVSVNNEASSTTPPDDSAEQKTGQEKKETRVQGDDQWLCWWHCFIVDRWMSVAFNRPVNIPVHIFDKTHLRPLQKPKKLFQSTNDTEVKASVLSPDFWLNPGSAPDSVQPRPSSKLNALSIGSGLSTNISPNLPGAQFRARAYFDQQCRQALLLDDILCFLASWSENLFVNSTEFEKLSVALDDWHRSLADWQSFPLSGIVGAGKSGQRPMSKDNLGGNQDREWIGTASSNPLQSTTNQDDGRDVVQSTLLGISFHTIRILLYRPFLRTNLRHPPCQPSRASAVCAQSANAMTSLAENLMNIPDMTIQPCLLMRHQFSLVTAAGIQLMNVNLDDEPRLSTPAKINLLKTIRILRDADRSSWGAGVRDGFRQVLGELFPVQMRLMYNDLAETEQ